MFLEVDEKGFYETLKAATVQTAVKTSADTRFQALATRREVIVGTNQYPNFTEKAESKIVKRRL